MLRRHMGLPCVQGKMLRVALLAQTKIQTRVRHAFELNVMR